MFKATSAATWRRDSYDNDSMDSAPLLLNNLPSDETLPLGTKPKLSRLHTSRPFLQRPFAQYFRSQSDSPTLLSPYYHQRRRRWHSIHTIWTTFWKLLYWTFLSLIVVTITTAVFFPSYSRPPAEYNHLRNAAKYGTEPARANTNSERIFIAASLYDPDGSLLRGRWGHLVKELVEILGPANTYVSIYVSDSGKAGASALTEYAEDYPCDHRFISEKHIDVDDLPIVDLPDGGHAVKRVQYLAKARNKALEPLQDARAPRYDRILYLNDAIFDPIEAAQLLLRTNTQEDGRAHYKAACAQDFKNPFIMYDMLALRDADGWQAGLPIFPWFSTEASGRSRKDVLSQTDAVQVKSCWGGMTAFDARYFQQPVGPEPATDASVPLKFRAEVDLFHDSSECCLIHADLMEQPGDGTLDDPSSTGIFTNPYVRTAYDEATFNWLWLGKRLERLLPPAQRLITSLAGLPHWNGRREVQAGEPLDQILPHMNGSDKSSNWQFETAPANPGGFCSILNLMIMRVDGDKQASHWETVQPNERDQIRKAIEDG